MYEQKPERGVFHSPLCAINFHPSNENFYNREANASLNRILQSWKMKTLRYENPYGFLMTKTANTKLANVMKIKRQINGNRKQQNPLEV